MDTTEQEKSDKTQDWLLTQSIDYLPIAADAHPRRIAYLIDHIIWRPIPTLSTRKASPSRTHRAIEADILQVEGSRKPQQDDPKHTTREPVHHVDNQPKPSISLIHAPPPKVCWQQDAPHQNPDDATGQTAPRQTYFPTIKLMSAIKPANFTSLADIPASPPLSSAEHTDAAEMEEIPPWRYNNGLC